MSDTHVSDSAREAPAQAGGFNLSDWALRNRSLVFFFMLAAAIAGAVSYMRLGREEDPAFTIKIMVVRALWPGATTEDTIRQVTDQACRTGRFTRDPRGSGCGRSPGGRVRRGRRG